MSCLPLKVICVLEVFPAFGTNLFCFMFLKFCYLIILADGDAAAQTVLSMSRLSSDELKLIGDVRGFEGSLED